MASCCADHFINFGTLVKYTVHSLTVITALNEFLETRKQFINLFQIEALVEKYDG